MEKTNLTVLLLSLGAGGETESQGYFSGAALFLPARAELPNALQGAFWGEKKRNTDSVQGYFGRSEVFWLFLGWGKG